MKYYVYVNNLIGVQTNAKSFHWSFGSDAPPAEEQAFLDCKVKIVLEIVKDRDVFPKSEENDCDGCFRDFRANCNQHDLYYSRSLPGRRKLNYAIRIENNTIFAKVGRSYAKLIRLKVMNIHPIGYILTDLVTMLLLKNGITTLYGATFSRKQTGALIMAPPKMGKTFTAVQLAQYYDARLLGEDICVFDGEKMFPVPWTNTYRKYGNQTGAVNREALFTQQPSIMTHLFILEKGNEKSFASCAEAEKKMQILNHYGLHYYCSPAVLTLCYFNDDLSVEELISKEHRAIRAIAEKTSVFITTSDSPVEYARMISEKLEGKASD